MFEFKILWILACFVLFYGDSAATGNSGENSTRKPKLEIITSFENNERIQAGSSFSLECHLNSRGQVWWMKNGKNLTVPEESNASKNWRMNLAKLENSGDYVCMGKTKGGILLNETIHVTVIDSATTISTKDGGRVKVGSYVNLWCDVDKNSAANSKWEKIGEPEKARYLKDRTEEIPVNETHSTMRLSFEKVDHTDNGTYACKVETGNGTFTSPQVPVIVIDVPEVKIDLVKPVGADSVYLNWTVNDHNEPVRKYVIEYSEHTNGSSDETWESQSKEIGTNDTRRFVLRQLKAGTHYRLRIRATNSVGDSNPEYFTAYIRTLEKDPEFIPIISGFRKTDRSIEINFSDPPEDLKDFRYNYKTSVAEGEGTPGIHTDVGVNVKSIIIGLLEPGTDYKIKVAACNSYTEKCGQWSAEQDIRTLNENEAHSSSGLHPADMNSVALSVASLYFVVKYLIQYKI